MTLPPCDHLKERAEERWGLRVTAKKQKQLVHQIVCGKAIFLRLDERHPDRSQWAVRIGKRFAKVVYCSKDAVIITIMRLNKKDWEQMRDE